jgi:hypothetical protein
LARKSKEWPLPCCKTGAKLKGNSLLGPLVSTCLSLSSYNNRAIPLHSMEALKWTGGIAPACSWLQTTWGWVVGNGMPQLCFTSRAWWVPQPAWTQRLEEKSFALTRDQTPVIQFIVRYYTNSATPAPFCIIVCFQTHVKYCKFTFVSVLFHNKLLDQW